MIRIQLMNTLLRYGLTVSVTLMLVALSGAGQAWERPVKTYRTLLGRGLSLDVHVTGEDQRHATVEFNSKQQHMGVVMLSPLRPEQFNLSFKSDTQSIHVEKLALKLSQEDEPGEVSIECNFTLVEDGPLLEYEGSLAQWKQPN